MWYSAWLGFNLAMLCAVVGLLECWKGRLGKHEGTGHWKTILLCLLYGERNAWTFEEEEILVDRLKNSFLRAFHE